MNRSRRITNIYCILFVIQLLCAVISSIGYCDWERTLYTPPSISPQFSDYTPLFGGDAFYRYNVYITYVSTYTAYTSVYAEIIYGDHQVSQTRGISNAIWDETYNYVGTPPTNFQWSWRGNADLGSEAYAPNNGDIDHAEGQGYSEMSVTVPNGSSSITTSSPLNNAYAKSLDGQVCAFNSYSGLSCTYSSGDYTTCIGITGNCSATGYTSGSGPYHRISRIVYIGASAIVDGNDEVGYGEEYLSFWLP